MLLSVKNTLVASVTALALAAATVAPANALGRNERNFLKGVAAAAIVGAIANDIRHKNRDRVTNDRYYRYDDNRFDDNRYYVERPRHQPRRHVGQTQYGSGLYQTPTARAFNSYSYSERRDIQRQLARYGYYRGGIDGVFGPNTYQAIYNFARNNNRTRALNSTSGAYGLLDVLLA